MVFCVVRIIILLTKLNLHGNYYLIIENTKLLRLSGNLLRHANREENRNSSTPGYISELNVAKFHRIRSIRFPVESEQKHVRGRYHRPYRQTEI